MGTVILFIFIQRLELIPNRKNSIEPINRESAKLILDLIQNNEEPEQIFLELSIIKTSYPDTDSFCISQIEALIRIRAAELVWMI